MWSQDSRQIGSGRALQYCASDTRGSSSATRKSHLGSPFTTLAAKAFNVNTTGSHVADFSFGPSGPFKNMFPSAGSRFNESSKAVKIVRSSSAMEGYAKREKKPEEVRRIKSAYGFRSEFENGGESELECLQRNMSSRLGIRPCDQNPPKDSVWRSVDPNVPKDRCSDYFSCFCVQLHSKDTVTSKASGFQRQEGGMSRETGAIRKQVVLNSPAQQSVSTQILTLASFR